MAAVLSTICTTNEPSFLYPLHGNRSRFALNHRLLIKLNLFMLSLRQNLAFVCPIDIEMAMSTYVLRRAQQGTCFGEKYSRLRSFYRTRAKCCKAIHVSLYNASRPMREAVQANSLLQQSSHANKTSIHSNSQTSPLYVHFRFPNIVDGEGNVGSPLRSAFCTEKKLEKCYRYNRLLSRSV
jgi:hypothetical protein